MRRPLLAFLLASLTLVAGLVAAPAALGCADPYTSTVFAPWGDTGQFSPIPGGAFEEGAQGWDLSGSVGLVGGGNPRAATPSARAIEVRSGGRATSPGFCLDGDDRYLRMVARAGGAHSHLKATLLWQDDRGVAKTTPLADMDGARGQGVWALSPPLRYGAARPKAGAPGRTVRVSFTVEGKDATWTLDDVSDAVALRDACPIAETARAFSRWGDENEYRQLPGGAFDDLASWETEGSPGLAGEGNPYGSGSSSAARLAGGDSITSAVFCIDRYHPHARFVRRALPKSGHLKVVALWTGDDGKFKRSPLDDSDANRAGTWDASREIEFKDALPSDDGARHVRLRFTVEGRSGAWLLDDVYVDPMKRG